MTKSNAKKVHQICQKCAEHNGGQWKPNNLMVPLSIGKCQVCNEVQPTIIHINHWKGLSSNKNLRPYSEKKLAKEKGLGKDENPKDSNINDLLN